MENNNNEYYAIGLDGAWVVEYSGQQGCFHVEEANKRFRENLSHAINEQNHSYYMVGIFQSQEEANEAVEIIREKQQQHTENE